MKVNIEASWSEKLNQEFESDYFIRLVDFVKQEYKHYPGCIFPKGTQIFRAFNECPFEKVKVVILGQDPYPTRGHAHGLSFSVDSTVHPLPKSLQNIYAELQTDVGVVRKNGDLSDWANQGVLLINSVLTVREGQPGSHANKGWEKFTDAVIQQLATHRENIVYVLWGSYAQKKGEHIDSSKNLVLKTVHPSPLSAYRGFFGSRPFSRINEYLTSNGLEPIKW